MKIKSIFSLVIFSIVSVALSAQQCPGAPTSNPSSATLPFNSSGGTSSVSSSSGAGSLVAGGLLSSLNRSMSSPVYQAVRESYSEVKGNPFLNETPINGTIVAKNGDVIENVPLQIDLYSHNVIATNGDGEEIALNGKFYDKVVMPYEGEDLVFKTSNPDKPNQFYEVLYDDTDLTFFKERKVRIIKSTSYNSETEAKFSSKKNNYFIKVGDQEVVNVKLKKKDIFSIFPDAELDAMKDYAQRNGIKLKNESDYVAVFGGVTKSFEE